MPKLTLAYTTLHDLKLLLPVVIQLKKQEMPVNIELEKVECRAIESYITKGICDVGLSFSDEFVSERLEKCVLKSGRYNALVAQGHPLFDNEVISVSELYKYPLLMLSEESMGESYLTMKERSLEDGYFPNIAREVADFEEGFFYILSEQLVGFGTEDYNLGRLSGVIRSIPIQESSHTYEIVLAYQKDSQHPALLRFLETVRAYQEIE